MRSPARWILVTAVLFISLQPAAEFGGRASRGRETARLLAKLLESGRAVIERNQSLIDDPHQGDKGFTPELFEQQLVREFHTKTGVDLRALPTAPVSSLIPPLAKGFCLRWFRPVGEVIRDAQVVINQRGIGYKNFIPATYGSQASARFSKGRACAAEADRRSSTESKMSRTNTKRRC